jgi:DNA-binding transcriptional MerR regulator
MKTSGEKKTPGGGIPDKLYFKIGEVAQIIGVKPYVLRYWETEFPEIAPGKSKSKQRLYKRKDVELILFIRDLLYQQKFTIEGARKRLKDTAKKGKPPEESKQIALKLPASGSTQAILKELKTRLVELERVLNEVS